jgi:hypothetical protein
LRDREKTELSGTGNGKPCSAPFFGKSQGSRLSGYQRISFQAGPLIKASPFPNGIQIGLQEALKARSFFWITSKSKRKAQRAFCNGANFRLALKCDSIEEAVIDESINQRMNPRINPRMDRRMDMRMEWLKDSSGYPHILRLTHIP